MFHGNPNLFAIQVNVISPPKPTPSLPVAYFMFHVGQIDGPKESGNVHIEYSAVGWNQVEVERLKQ